ncbi:MAG: tetratricopeptide repeat protein [Bryobacteraceae bacterium]
MMLTALIALLFAAPDYDRAVRLIESGNPAAAIPLLEKAAAAEARNPQIRKALGVAYASLGDYRSAAPHFERACEIDPALFDVCYYAGRARYAADQYREAIPLLEKSVKQDPQKARAEAALGQCLEALGRYGEAQERFVAALRRTGQPLGEAQLAYGKFLVRQGRPAEAVPMLESAQSLGTTAARFELALALVQAGRVSAAIPHLEAITSADPRHDAARLLLVRARRLAKVPAGESR